MKQSLVEKYDIQAPRYTSYPRVPYWENAPTENEWFQDIEKTFLDKGRSVDIYIHIPFCRQICHYCGCNRLASSNQELMENYVSTLLQEWGLYRKRLGDFSLASLHLGGGTPTWLKEELLSKLLNGVSEFTLAGSVEVDPRVTSKKHLEILYQKGLRRLSMGIQDFHPEVQNKIGRIQELELVQKMVAQVRDIGFEELNFDLIFGLPSQTEESLTWTFEQVAKLQPDTIAFYSFAYVPHFAKNQSHINLSDVPQGIHKRRLYELGRELLFSNGYIEIGMDHFALPSSSLAVALKEKKLTRSFMGYTVRKAPVLIGLGCSSISSSSLSFVQNDKDIENYNIPIQQGRLPIFKGHKQTLEDIETEKTIQEIMCLGETHIPENKKVILSDFLADHLIEIQGQRLLVTEEGRPFLRNIAYAFDYRAYKNSKTGFSRTI